MINGICDNCAEGWGRGGNRPKEHHCAGNCACGSCNNITVAYNSGALAYLQRIAPSKGLLTIGGFGLLQAATALYFSFGVWAPVVTFGLLAENLFFLQKAWEEFKHGR